MSELRERLLIVGNPEPIHVGAHLLSAARHLGLDVRLCDSAAAYRAAAWRRRFDWWLRGHRPSQLTTFGEQVVNAARDDAVRCVLSTGLAPLDARTLETLGGMGIRRLNFLTDDPWNPEHRAPWFLKALSRYDHVFTPRKANIPELRALGGPTISYLPFAYAPEAHYPEPAATPDERQRFAADLVFAGGADDDRLATLAPFVEAGFRVALYGGYWDRHRAMQASARGLLDATGLRKAITTGKVNLCLVRRANRDGHAMRTFEVAAMGGCMLVEETDDHRELFGPDDDAVVYFRTPAEGVERLGVLLADPDRRARLSRRVRELVTAGEHTYASRLRQMQLTSARREVA